MAVTAPKASARKSLKRSLPNLFDSEYAKLNPAQKKAVDTVEGPVMVVAGPGTGKTQVVAMRVANILRKTHMRPGNILCLTFSVSGVTAMRDRLRLLIGADAYGVRVSTIHAFCSSIIDENALVFEEFSAREQISDLQKVREMNTIIDQYLPHSIGLNPKDPYGKTLDLLSRISQVKREGKTLSDLLSAADIYDGEMASKSKPGTKVHEKNLLAAKKFRDFIEIFRRYQEMLTKTGRFDYDDMILHVLRALKEEDWLLSSLQERFQYILVDEFQDLNGSQYALIKLLTTYKDLPHDPNIFVVGDDDQSIYRFQGANLKNMVSFHERFSDAPVIPLTVSYRSTQAILNAAQSLIEKNEERLVGKIPGLQKQLTSSSGKGGIAPRLLRSPSDTAELWLTADLVEDRVQAGVEPSEIAVLTQTNDELFPLYEALRVRKIPAVLSGKDDLLTHPLVAQALAILRAIDHPTRDGLLVSALGCDALHLHPADIGRLCAAGREQKRPLWDILADFPQSILGVNDVPGIESARDFLFSLHQKVGSRTVLETVENVLRGSGIISLESEDPRDPAAVQAFFDYVQRRSFEKRGLTLHEFLDDLKIYTDPAYGQVRLTYELPHLTASGVRLLTAHQSKGLEFDIVILTNFRDGHWDKRKRPVGVSIPEDILFGWQKEQKAFEHHQDERRVAFVACTRARRELLMTCPHEVTVGEKSRSISPSGFFAEMGALSEEEGVLRNPEAASLLLHPRPRPIDDAMRGYLQEQLKTFALSPTSLTRFLVDPQQFLLVDLLKQPDHFEEGSIRSLGYGSAVHWALRQWATAKKSSRAFTSEDFLRAFQWYMNERTILTDNQRRDLLGIARDALPKYFEQKLTSVSPFFHSIERDFKTHIDGIPIKGKIDRIDLETETSAVATVIDYKTGRAKTEGEVRGGLDPGIVSRSDDGSNFRQLAFYALLLEHAEPLLKPKTFTLEFIGERGEHPISRSFAISDDEKKDLKKLIKEVWSKVTALDFTSL